MQLEVKADSYKCLGVSLSFIKPGYSNQTTRFLE